MLPTIKIRFERWKFNKDYGVYVSTHGRFRNRDKADLPIKINQKGYCCVKVDCTTCATQYAHRLVMLTWRPTDEAENLTVDHKNHNKRDNALDNLEWVTFEENIQRAKVDFIAEELDEQASASTFAGVPYGQLYTAFEISPIRAPATNKVSERFTVRNGDTAITEALVIIKKQMGAEFESKKMRQKIKAVAQNKELQTVSCYGFNIRGIKA